MPWMFRKQWQGDGRIEGKTAVVTGSNTGVGYHTALELYKRGGKVILAGRSISRLNEAVESIRRRCIEWEGVGELEVAELDLSSLESVRKCAKLLLRQEKVIHILVNNAGVVSHRRQLSEDGYEQQFATNHLGHFLLTSLLLPRLVRSAPARVVNLTSEPHCIANDINLEDINCERSFFYHTAYGQTKLANILFSNELARRLKAAGVSDVTVYSVNPGAVDTRMSDEFAAMILPGVRWLYRRLKWLFMQSPAEGARTVVYCAVAAAVAQQTGLYYTNCEVAIPPKSTKNEERAKQLWDKSWEMAHLDKDFDIFTPA